MGTNTYAYDPLTGRRTAVTNALGQATHTAYDADFAVLAAELAEGASLASCASPISLDLTTWLYDPTGLLTNKLYADGCGIGATATVQVALAVHSR